MNERGRGRENPERGAENLRPRHFVVGLVVAEDGRRAEEGLAELDGKVTHRNGVQRNEVHEKDGNLAVPGQHSNVQHALHSNQMPEDIAQITQSGISDPDQDI